MEYKTKCCNPANMGATRGSAKIDWIVIQLHIQPWGYGEEQRGLLCAGKAELQGKRTFFRR